MPTNSRKKKRIDVASIAVILITVILFGISVVEKDFTHELLLEAGVFLVSIKLVLASMNHKIAASQIEEKLHQILANRHAAPLIQPDDGNGASLQLGNP